MQCPGKVQNQTFFVMKELKYFFLLFVFLSAFQCEKDPTTEPIEVNFDFRINKQANSENYLWFDDGEAYIGEIEFDGQRSVGEDVYFVSNFEKTIRKKFKNHWSGEPVKFDIPQGEYDKIGLKISFLYDEHTNSGVGEGNEFPRLTVEGAYLNTEGEEIPVLVECEMELIFSIYAQSSDNKNITLNSTKENIAIAQIDPLFWFQPINRNTLEHAELNRYQGRETLIINQFYNSDIFYILASRVENSMTVTFE